MSKQSRAWLLQVPDKDVYAKVVTPVANALMETGYFTDFYLATNREFVSPINTREIHLKRDFGWSDNIINALAYVREKTFFMGCEDHLLVDYDEELVDMAYRDVANGEYGCVRLSWKPKIPIIEYGMVVPIDKSYRYYVSCQPTVWNKDYLESIIRPGETSWQFEICASQRAKKLELPAGVTYKTAFNYRNLIEKGKLAENPKTYTEIHGT